MPPALQPTYGTPPSYIPAEYPKAGRNPKIGPNGQTATAKDAAHEAQLTEAGFEFPVFVPAVLPGISTNASGKAVQEYPKALHGPGGKTIIAKNPDHESTLNEAGWRDTPYPPSTPAPTPGPPSPLWPLQASSSNDDDLRNKIAELRHNLDAANAATAKAAAERDAVQLRLDTAPNQSKAKLQQALDDLQAKHDELKNAHEELLSVVTNPQTPAE